MRKTAATDGGTRSQTMGLISGKRISTWLMVPQRPTFLNKDKKRESFADDHEFGTQFTWGYNKLTVLDVIEMPRIGQVAGKVPSQPVTPLEG